MDEVTNMRFVDTSEIFRRFSVGTRPVAACDETNRERSDGFREAKTRSDIKAQGAISLPTVRIEITTRL